MEDIQFLKGYSSLVNPSYGVINSNTQISDIPCNDKINSDFNRLLQENINKNSEITFSKHAKERIDSRNICISPELVSKLSDAVNKASAKGVNDALIVNGETAFIVNIPSKTVITTMNSQEMSGNIFTNIDGAVLL